MELNKYIDHTNLKNTSTLKDIEKLCNEAIKYRFASVCVYPYYVGLASNLLKETNVEVCTVVGFPSGMSTKETKVYEAIDAVEKGATEIDMVINVAALKNKDYNYIKEEIEEIRDAIDGKVLKVIIETCLLTKEEIIKMTEICNETFVNFIKTSTGFSEYGARVQDVELMNKYKNEVLEIKASGGIRDLKTAEDMINAGATRLGTSSGVKLMKIECNCGCEHDHDCICGDDCHCKEGK
ncbi:MAG: deoxyribose-phosphate aldolase [Bacilli bacterium]|nr:deoxyribose-phosphate aldolase [Bacilli bacterium]